MLDIFGQYFSTVRLRTKSVMRIELFFIFLLKVDVPFKGFTPNQSSYVLGRNLLSTVILRTIKDVGTWTNILVDKAAKAIITKGVIAALLRKLGS